MKPYKHTLPQALRPVNGSDALGGCTRHQPLAVGVGLDSTGVCMLRGSGGGGGGGGAESNLVNGVCPALNAGSFSSSTWASGLVTLAMRRSANQKSSQIGFDFGTNVSLSVVELELFNCPAWGIGPASITVFTIRPPFRVYPQFDTSIANVVGSLNSTSMPSSCESLVRVCVPVDTAGGRGHRFYHVRFTYLECPAAAAAAREEGSWVAIAEAHFKTPPPPTDGNVIKRCRRRAAR